MHKAKQPSPGLETDCKSNCGYELPQTGGTGTYGWTGAGVLLTILSMICLLKKRKYTV